MITKTIVIASALAVFGSVAIAQTVEPGQTTPATQDNRMGLDATSQQNNAAINSGQTTNGQMNNDQMRRDQMAREQTTRDQMATGQQNMGTMTAQQRADDARMTAEQRTTMAQTQTAPSRNWRAGERG